MPLRIRRRASGIARDRVGGSLAVTKRAPAREPRLSEEPRPRRPAPRRSKLPAGQVAADFLAAALAALVAYWFRYHVYPTNYIPGGEPPDLARYLAAAPVVGVCAVVVFALMGAYRFRRGIQFVDELFSIIGALAVTFVLLLALEGLYREQHFTYSRLTLFYWFPASILVVGLERYLGRRLGAT